MKQLRKSIIIIISLVLFLLLPINQQVFAENDTNSIKKAEYSEEFKKWLELSDEEKAKVIQPRMYDIENTSNISKNPLYKARMIAADVDTTFNLKNIIPDNLLIKNQKQTNTCWAFAALSSLETNLALANWKSKTNTSVIYDFSERHMEYATSRNFKNGAINTKGYNRNVGEGGNWYYAQSYLTNGLGAINESGMKFENNEEQIELSEIQNKTVTSQVYDTIEFEDYLKADDSKKNEIIKQIKQHIQNYGSVYASIHGNSSSTSFPCYNSETSAKYCRDSITHKADHAVSIVGWNDDFPIENFTGNVKPKSKGAWIIRNSWGEKEEYKLQEIKEILLKNLQNAGLGDKFDDVSKITDDMIKSYGFTIEGDTASMKIGDNGLMYVSYEDNNISKTLFGIVKASDDIDYENIYQYDEYYPASVINLSTNKMILCNVFNRKNQSSKEYLTQVSIYAPENYTCKVYVNPTGDGKTQNELKQVQLKAGNTEKFNAGYHTLEFANPVEITGDKFAVAIEIEGTKSDLNFSLEAPINDIAEWNAVQVEKGKCFFAVGNDLSNCQWQDIGQLSTSQLGTGLLDGDSTIKAFTVSHIYDGSLEKIEITKMPTKTDYFEGDNFEKDGMEVTAYYNRKKDPTVILKSGEYSITNGSNLQAGQTSVTITYQDKSVEQPIEVQENSIVSLQIIKEPDVTTYKEGQSFKKDGMVVEAIYKNGITKTITDYKIEDGNNLDNNQTYVTILYSGQIVKQPIKVTQNPLQSIEITKKPNKTDYFVGENFDSTGMIVTGTYQDNDIYEIVDYTIKNGTNLNLNQTEVTIEYKEKTTTQEITVKSKATNSNLDNIRTEVQKVQAYYFTNNSQNNYTLIDVEIDKIVRNLDNDNVEYYYYLSPNPSEQDINNWTKITENQNDSNKLQFTIDTRKITNYNEIASEEVMYLYIKEVAIKDGNQSSAISKPMKLETDKKIDIYVDNAKNENLQSSNNAIEKLDKNDDSIAKGELPHTGVTTLALFFLIVIIPLCIFFYKKYKNYKDIK